MIEFVTEFVAVEMCEDGVVGLRGEEKCGRKVVWVRRFSSMILRLRG